MHVLVDLVMNLILLIIYLFLSTVPIPFVNINILNNQTVGQSLTLESSITTVRGITSRVDIVWSSNGSILKLIQGLNNTFTSNTSVLYTDTYVIPQLRSTDEGRDIQCEISINAASLVQISKDITLNVTGK